MKNTTKFLSTFVLFVIISCSIKGQSLRYFEFKTLCYDGINNTWEDSSFIAATSNKNIIDTIYIELTKPEEMRRAMGGMIDTGNAGYNHNASHWFSWHFIEDKWGVGGGGIELCDGCPTNVDVCVSCFIKAGGYCPWSSYVLREISITAVNEFSSMDHFSIYPNPVRDKLEIKRDNSELSEIIIYDFSSRKLIQEIFNNKISINTGQMATGMYIYELRNKNGIITKGKIIKQ